MVLTSECHSERQPEVSIWPPKSEVVISLKLWQIASKFQRQIRDFRWWRARLKSSQLISTTKAYRKLKARAQKLYIIMSGCRLSAQSLGASLFELGVAENSIFAVGIVILPLLVQEIQVFPVSTAVILFPVDGHCRNHLGTLYSDSSWSKIPDLPLEFRRYEL